MDESRRYHAQSTGMNRVHTVRWDFGDGTHALGWAVTHRYAHAGIYRVTVQAYYSTWHRYFPFDNVRISIAP